MVMADGELLVFVEVRSRRTARWGSAAESVTPAKRRRLLGTAGLFIARHRQWQQAHCRFDLVAFDGDSPQWMQSAFGTDT